MKPQDIHQQFASYFKAKDLAGLVSLFHEQAVFVPGEGRELLRDKKAIAAELATYLTSEGQAIETTSTKVYETGDTALIIAKWTITTKQGKVDGQAIEVLIKEAGRWLYLIDNPHGV